MILLGRFAEDLSCTVLSVGAQHRHERFVQMAPKTGACINCSDAADRYIEVESLDRESELRSVEAAMGVVLNEP